MAHVMQGQESQHITRHARTALKCDAIAPGPTCIRVLVSAALTMGVISPPSVATATHTSTLRCCTAASEPLSQKALAAGVSRRARAAARSTKSFTDTLVPCASNIAAAAAVAQNNTQIAVESQQQSQGTAPQKVGGPMSVLFQSARACPLVVPHSPSPCQPSLLQSPLTLPCPTLPSRPQTLPPTPHLLCECLAQCCQLVQLHICRHVQRGRRQLGLQQTLGNDGANLQLTEQGRHTRQSCDLRFLLDCVCATCVSTDESDPLFAS
jgi:hypothetical protein